MTTYTHTAEADIPADTLFGGELQVEEVEPGRSRVTVSLHSVRVAEDDEVQRGLEQAVTTPAHPS